MAYWLVKTEPETYSWEMLERDGKTQWSGIRNFEARNNMRAMKLGDKVFVYHSGVEKMIMGVAEVCAEAVPDPTAEKGDWVMVELKALKPFLRVLSLDEIRNTYLLSVMPLTTQSRLSVQPVTDDQAKMILKIAKTEV